MSSDATETTESKLEIGKLAEGDVVCLRFAGTLDEDFDPKQIPSISGARAVILHVADIQRISSFGIRQWVEFMQLLDKQCELTVMIDCSSKVVDQLNMVANFAGSAMVYSFSAPYHCDYCEHDEALLLRCDDDWPTIKERKLADRECPSCGENSYFDGDAVSYLTFAVTQGKVELDPGVAKFLAASLGHEVSAASRRLRVEKGIFGRFVSMKLTGDIDAKFPTRNLADGAEGNVVFDVAGISSIDADGEARWRQLMQEIIATTDRVFISHASPAFALKLLTPGDLHAKIEVVSISIPYRCDECEVVASHLVDIDRHYERLHEAQPPPQSCPDCRATTTCIATDDYRRSWRSLPKPRQAGEVRKALRQRGQSERREKNRNKNQRSRRLGLGAALSAAALAAAIVLGILKFSDTSDAKPESKNGLTMVSSSGEERPPWLPADVVSYGNCEAGAEDVVCVGVWLSSKGRGQARATAGDAVLEALTLVLAARIEDEQWKAAVGEIGGAPRERALADVDAVARGPHDVNVSRAMRNARDGRGRVAKLLRETAGSAAPTFATEEYWEEYETKSGDKRSLIAVKYVVSNDQMTRMLDVYTQRASAFGGTAVTVFPALAWRYPEVSGGAFVIDAGEGKLAELGITPGDIVLSVRDRLIGNAADFARIVEEESATLGRTGGVMGFAITDETGQRREVGLNIEARSTAAPKRRKRKRDAVEAPMQNSWTRSTGGRDDPYR